VEEVRGGRKPAVLGRLFSHWVSGRAGQDSGLEHRWLAHGQLLGGQRHHAQVSSFAYCGPREHFQSKITSCILHNSRRVT
jgi:hypothetical protein